MPAEHYYTFQLFYSPPSVRAVLPKLYRADGLIRIVGFRVNVLQYCSVVGLVSIGRGCKHFSPAHLIRMILNYLKIPTLFVAHIIVV
jgi:hypothetical protein